MISCCFENGSKRQKSFDFFVLKNFEFEGDVMTTRVVTDKQLEKLSRRIHDLFERVRTGGVDFQETLDGLQCLAEKKSETINSHGKDIAMCQKFYQKVFGESQDFSEVRIPEKPEGDWWLIVLVKGMTPEELFQRCREKFGAWKWTNKSLDEIIVSDRTAKDGHYAIWVKANIEADEEFKNLFANQLKAQNHKGITLEERLVLELFYFWRTKKHLDNQNWTLCAGSRYSDGDIPYVSWNDGRMDVYRCYPDSVHDHLRSRRVVS
ncbi:MAG TPA: hypothetical protein DCS28_02095 [Candidatus Moranbacteria bacterium]|nr:hypothetical protein [Candidatus Moranbacteria bacterium]